VLARPGRPGSRRLCVIRRSIRLPPTVCLHFRLSGRRAARWGRTHQSACQVLTRRSTCIVRPGAGLDNTLVNTPWKYSSGDAEAAGTDTDAVRGIDVAALQTSVLGWYEGHGRRLAFRGTTDPYAVLVSEVMAQQTQVGRVGPAWAAFMTRFPTVDSLAEASPAEVIRAWAGLGYNRRALNLRAAAQVIVARHGGNVPADLAQLEALPGVGPYSARAVGSIAFGMEVAAVDTNVRRVVGRIVMGHEAVPAAELQLAANELVPNGRAADWTHAVMDVGATFCGMREPCCTDCPARTWCRFAGTPLGTARLVPAAVTSPAALFPSSQRWLRGRIVARLREAETSQWLRFRGDIGKHGASAVQAALAKLADEGLLERHPDDPQLARLPIGSTAAGQ
jgi:A/G-specific adenine glycosylase